MPPNKILLDDCFLHDRDRLRHGEALEILKARVAPVTGTELIPTERALGRILAEPVTAARPVPPHANAAVDGFAFSFADYDRTAGASLPVIGRAAAGHPLAGRPARPCAVRIFTGAMMPPDLDTIVMQEDVSLQSGKLEDSHPIVVVPGGLKLGANVRKAGEDVAEGEPLLAAGDRLRPQDLAALASVGVTDVVCHRRLRVGIVSTGDEIMRLGPRQLGPGEIFDANAPMLDGLVGLSGAEAVDLGLWPDNERTVRSRLAAAAEQCDVILTSGGASRGEEDHMVRAIEAMGRRHLWQLAIKPGRPMSFGQIGDTVILGLPGNPVAVLVCYLLYAAPVLSRLGGGHWSEPRRFPLPAAFAFPKRKTGRREFWRGILKETNGRLAIDKFDRDGSGLISGLRAADGLIEIPEDVPEVAPGDLVSFIPFAEFGIRR